MSSEKRVLPARPNLDHLKSQARDLLAAFQAKDVEARSRIRAGLPLAHGLNDEKLAALGIALHDAQSVVAREYGFPSWSELKKHVEAVAAANGEMAREMIERHALNPAPPAEILAALSAAAQRNGLKAEPNLPAAFPLIALRNAALTKGALAPLAISRPASRAAIDQANASDSKLLVIFSQKDEATETPTETDLHGVGVLARLEHVHENWIVVRGIDWVHLERHESGSSSAEVSRFEVNEQQREDEEVVKLDSSLRAHVRAFALAQPHPEALLALTEKMSPLELADITIANLPCPVDAKARYASEPNLKARLELVLSLMNPS